MRCVQGQGEAENESGERHRPDQDERHAELATGRLGVETTRECGLQSVFEFIH